MRIGTIAIITILTLCMATGACSAYAGASDTTPIRQCKTNFGPVSKGSCACKERAATCTQASSAEQKRGLANMLLGWTEIPKSICEVTCETKNPIWGLTGGACKGIGKAIPRTVGGAADIVEPTQTKKTP